MTHAWPPGDFGPTSGRSAPCWIRRGRSRSARSSGGWARSSGGSATRKCSSPAWALGSSRGGGPRAPPPPHGAAPPPRLGARIESIGEPWIAAAKMLLDDLELQRVGARRRLLEGLRSERFGTLVDRLVEGATDPRSVDGGTADGAETAGTLMSRPWRRLVRAAGRLGPQPEDADLHRVRIEVKRVRYAAEAFSPALGTRADRFAAAARALQELLGEHHDAVVSLAWLTANGIGADDTSVAFAAGRLAEYESRERDRHRDAWPGTWARLDKRKRFWT